jgi:hypothetical protein
VFYVLTVDQRRSRDHPDRVPEALQRLAQVPTVRPFERTAGDEFQGVLDEPEDVVDAVLSLVRDHAWSIGVGIGPVEEPLPETTRAGRGQAFSRAREAVESAKKKPQRVAVVGPDGSSATDAQAVLTLLAAVVQGRSPAAWKAIELLAEGRNTAQVAATLGISRQAVGQRLAVALWQQEQQARPVAAHLLRQAAA